MTGEEVATGAKRYPKSLKFKTSNRLLIAVILFPACATRFDITIYSLYACIKK